VLYLPWWGCTEVLKRPAYLPNLAPSDYFLLPNLKIHLKGRKFMSTEATLNVDRWFVAQAAFFLNGLKKLEQQGHKCVDLRRGICKYIFFKSHSILFSF
jgi:hypothetical protein